MHVTRLGTRASHQKRGLHQVGGLAAFPGYETTSDAFQASRVATLKFIIQFHEDILSLKSLLEWKPLLKPSESISVLNIKGLDVTQPC